MTPHESPIGDMLRRTTGKFGALRTPDTCGLHADIDKDDDIETRSLSEGEVAALLALLRRF